MNPKELKKILCFEISVPIPVPDFKILKVLGLVLVSKYFQRISVPELFFFFGTFPAPAENRTYDSYKLPFKFKKKSTSSHVDGGFSTRFVITNTFYFLI